MLLRRTFSSASLLRSGHSKWSKIKHGKGVEDAKRSQINSKASKDITRAARLGGSLDPALNSALAAALKQARRYDVPSATIQRALNKASGQKGSSNLHSVLYEALVDGKVALLVECLTDNTNRANHGIRNIINDGGGRLAPVAYLFSKKAKIVLRLSPGSDPDEFLEKAIASGIEEVDEKEEGVSEILAAPQMLNELTQLFTSAPYSHELIASEFTYVASEKLHPDELEDESRKRVQILIGKLLDDEDCVLVHTNMTTPVR